MLPAQVIKAISATEIVANLAKLDNWMLCGDGPDIAVEKTYSFASYAQTMVFVNAVAWLAQARQHHPDLLVQYQRCRVQWHTHDVAGLSRLDFDCAAAVDALLNGQPSQLP
jgi:4a-hydroxytetrahydrobiopterin dehydratase